MVCSTCCSTPRVSSALCSSSVGGESGPGRKSEGISPRYGLAMAETYESVSVEIKDRVAQVTLIGPGKGNAMGPAFWSEMPDVFAALDADRDVRAIVIAGSGKNFSYGLDVPAMGGSFTPLLADGALAGPRADFHAEIRRMQNAISAIADCRTPTIASVHGWCIGGGV